MSSRRSGTAPTTSPAARVACNSHRAQRVAAPGVDLAHAGLEVFANIFNARLEIFRARQCHATAAHIAQCVAKPGYRSHG